MSGSGSRWMLRAVALTAALLIPAAPAMDPWASVHCAVRREISPCTCRMQEQLPKSKKSITVTCEGMTNFQQVITALQGKFDKSVGIILRISHSNLDDLPQLSFQQLGLEIHQLWLSNTNLSALPESVFSGLEKVESFGLIDNAIIDVPQQVLKLMPEIKVLDLNGGRIANISSSDFEGLKFHTLTMHGNCVSLLERNSLPSAIHKLTLSQNKISTLNGALRQLLYLEWLWLNNNGIETLDGELPQTNPNTNLKFMAAEHNKITRLPQDLRHFIALKNLVLSNNRITSLDGAISTTKRLEDVDLDHNLISTLYPDDFMELQVLKEIRLGHNRISHLNGSLLPLKNLRTLNLTHNEIIDFNLQEIRGLRKLSLLDVSHNKIRVISGKFGNSVELEPKVIDLRMEHNELRSLYGGLTGFNGLKTVNLSHNLLESITADDIKGLDELLILDISHNHLTTLDGTSQIVLPSLEELIASRNWMSSLETDFYGLPKLCWADFSHNRISFVSAGLADKTQCRLYGVNSTLRIYLQGNPAMCDAAALAAITRLESRNSTKVHGINECPPPLPPTSTTPLTPVLVSYITHITPSQPTPLPSFPTSTPSTVAKDNLITTPATTTTTTTTTTSERNSLSPPESETQPTSPQAFMTNDIPLFTSTPTPHAHRKSLAEDVETTTPKLAVFEIIEYPNGNSTIYTASDLSIPVNLPLSGTL